MRILITLLAGILILSSCSKENGASKSREFYADQKLTLTPDEPNSPILLEGGDDLVFRYLFNHPQQDNIADDELSEIFIFSIAATETSFSFSIDDPNTAAYYRLCFCYFGTAFTFESLTVSGKKINETRWQVSFEMTATDGDHTYHIKDEGIYKLNTRTI